jgi:hypothetical protein
MAQGYWQTLVSQQAAGTAVAATVTRTSATVGSTQARYTMPGNTIKQVGDQLLLEATGIISTVVTTPGTETIDFAMATVANCTTGAMTLNIVAQTNQPWYLRMLMTAISVGAGTAAQFRYTGYWLSTASLGQALGATGPDNPGGQIVPYTGTATGASTLGTTFDSTISQLLDLYFTSSISTAGSSIQLLQYNLTLMTATGF